MKKRFQKRMLWLPLFLFFLAFALLFGFRSMQQIADSLAYAYEAKYGADMFNPHHLLFTPIVHLLYNFFQLFYAEISVITAAQIHNILWAGVAIISFYFICLKLFENKYAALLAAIVLLVSHRFWEFSTQVEVYVPAVAPLMVISALLFCRTELILKWKTTLIFSGLLALSVFYHQTGVLFLLPLGIFYFLSYKTKGPAEWLKIIAITGFVVLAAYLIVYFSTQESYSLQGFIRYCLQYAYKPNPDWGTFHNFSWEQIKRLAFNQGQALISFYHASKVPAYLWFTAIAAVFIWNIYRAVVKTAYTNFRLFLLVFLIIYYLFLLWWTPGFEFFVLTVPPFLLLCFFMIKDVAEYEKKYRNLIVMTGLASVVIVFIYTNKDSFAYYHNETHPGNLEAAYIKAHDNNCTIITNFNIIVNLLYFFEEKNSIETEDIFNYYYYSDSLPEKYLLKSENCLIIALWHLNPWYNVAGKTGHDLPEKWYRFAENLFAFEYENGRAVSARAFEVIPPEDERYAYLFIKDERIKINGAAEFFSLLDSAIAQYNLEQQKGYEKWYENNAALIKSGGI